MAYLNVDSAASGPKFSPSAVASLAPLVVEASRAVPNPAGGTLYDSWLKTAQMTPPKSKRGTGPSPEQLVDVRIGSGSDHTVFLNHLGRPTVGLTFVGPYGVCHSIYDDFFWVNRIGDPGYR